MRLRTVFRTLLVGLLSLSVFGLQSPAEATTAGTVTFQGTASVSPGLRSPGADDVPDGVLDPLTHGPAASWSFESDVCVDLRAHILKRDLASAHTDFCSISASGTLNGWCGRSHGTGSGMYVHVGGQDFLFTLKWTSAAGTLVITGTITKTSTGRTGDLNAVVNTTTVGGSCAEGIATEFLNTGVFSFLVS